MSIVSKLNHYVFLSKKIKADDTDRSGGVAVHVSKKYSPWVPQKIDVENCDALAVDV